MNKKQAIKAIKKYTKEGAGKVIAAYVYMIEWGKWTAVCHCEDNIGHIYITVVFENGKIFHQSYRKNSNDWLQSVEGTDRFQWIIEPTGPYCEIGNTGEYAMINF